MSSSEQALAKRIRELRRRHFGPRGKAMFAQRLGLPVDEYSRFERGTIPPGDVLVRMCEATGEDLQWLLTGVASRGTVVISGARHRHSELLARIANLLSQKPQLAAPLEAFVDLLMRGEEARAVTAPELPWPKIDNLIRIFETDDVPESLPSPDAPDRPLLVPAAEAALSRQPTAHVLYEPAMSYTSSSAKSVKLVKFATSGGHTCVCMEDAEIARCFPSAFGVRLADDTMAPMFCRGDAAVVAIGSPAQVGRPTVCRLAGESRARCRIWLGRDAGQVHLGRLADGEMEQVPPDRVQWALEALFRLAPAA